MEPFRIVAVDDEPWALQGLIRAYDWEKNGFRVILDTLDPYEAKKHILERSPEAAFVDIKMNGMDGLSLIKECRSGGSKTVFQIVTAYDDFEYAKTAISLGVFEYILKPIDSVELHTCMERLKELLASRFEAGEGEAARQPGADADIGGFDELLAYIHAHYAEDIRLSVLSDRFFYSQTYICDLFRKKLNTTLSEYLNDIRLREAYHLITRSGHSTTAVAGMVGYNSYSYFSKLFRLRFGVTPSRLGKG